ncbi:hypothetical protein DW322_13215 [Rhodococcus rhodnii]|uniref:Uncharacterized protein n=2 Tax=Rhodococcus rhodnii TaxID=38312 RepID=R7WKK7_9NOCA|nr:hypothetical protein [Rhodococcus rhodnii]EOM75828.1 hypothetical protein Rrhod_2734 [Rhodococcus rhodnii LMG 5362]TXG91009.1 hypothetical protein DW322_13215 [Rhodococcus rhodnii]
MSSELNVDPAVLHQAAEGITAIIDSLSGLGIGETAAAGRGFSALALSPMEAGAESVQKSLEEYAERWAWGVRHLVRAANDIAEVLDLQAGRYHMMEQANEEMLKTMWTHAFGNPHLDGDEISERSWGETFADNPFNHAMNPDYSSESFDDAFEHVRTNREVIDEVGPQALANVSPLAAMLGDEDAGYDTGAAERAAAIVNGE